MDNYISYVVHMDSYISYIVQIDSYISQLYIIHSADAQLYIIHSADGQLYITHSADGQLHILHSADHTFAQGSGHQSTEGFIKEPSLSRWSQWSVCVRVAFKQVILAFRPSCRFPKAVSDAKMVCCQKKKPRPITSLSGPLFDDRDCREVEGRRAGLKNLEPSRLIGI